MSLEELEQVVRTLFVTHEVAWETFSRVAASAASVRLYEGVLEYGTKFNTDLSLVARQDERRFHVVSTFLELGRQEMYARQKALTKPLTEFNAGVEQAALEKHLAAHNVRVNPWDGGVAYEPKCFYPYSALEWGNLKSYQHHESTRLYEAALAFLKTHPQGGAMDSRTAWRLLSSA